ncbi:HAMP domain-containing sensor histidine kinase [Desulforamulus ruminis]|uniref:histidine kinase n=1 Tax=Desulforamulus ruminis (strain ATCC 23193 / DSM 2154 / NCIMB 8452 / DL) TaxID=696281 RepID=F6DR17_DESRL|nr:ATP-binding protein [Desulforamulus ruminis]AEG59736.1 ATP-binding region ATPase domain protein [Desulforamulus ruminis DSM 2154]
MKGIALKNNIAVKLLALIVLSLVVSTLTFLFLGHHFSFQFWTDPSHYAGNLVMKYNSIILLIFLISIGIFIGIFIFPVNKKLTYIKYLTNQVSRISEVHELGLAVEIKGNDELAQLALSINAMSRELQRKFERERENEKTKNELITNLSHDLRSPLTSIIGYIDLIKRNKFNHEDELTEYIDTIYHKSQNLKKLLDELFEYTKLSNPGIRLDYQEIELGGLLEQMIGEYLPIFEREGLALQKDFPREDIEIDLDVEQMVRVFTNLLENARKYSIKPSEVRVSLNKAPDHVRISFINGVKKLPAQQPEKLFERFYKEDSSRTEESGSGLGLAIAQKIVELHKGSIGVEYLANEIEFVIELPLSQYSGFTLSGSSRFEHEF